MLEINPETLPIWTRYVPASAIILLTPAHTVINSHENKIISPKGVRQLQLLSEILNPLLPLIRKNYQFTCGNHGYLKRTIHQVFNIPYSLLSRQARWLDYEAPLVGFPAILSDCKKIIYCSDAECLRLGLVTSGINTTLTEPLETLFLGFQDKRLTVLARLQTLVNLDHTGSTLQ